MRLFLIHIQWKSYEIVELMHMRINTLSDHCDWSIWRLPESVNLISVV